MYLLFNVPSLGNLVEETHASAAIGAQQNTAGFPVSPSTAQSHLLALANGIQSPDHWEGFKWLLRIPTFMSINSVVILIST